MASPSSGKSVEPWLISVKTLGGFIKEESDDDDDSRSNGTEGKGEKQFTIEVSPEDGLSSLQDKIEASTGLKASQQRLIYRGRIISAKDNEESEESSKQKIKDIAGLSDGQTIHLVKKREVETPNGNSNSDSATNPSSEAAARSSLANDLFGTSSVTSVGGSGGSGSLLAALLGLGSISDDNEDRDSTRQRWGYRNTRRQRRPHYRLTADDLELPDPGSMEPVRQGLMTLHTLLPHADLTEENSPLEANREWYRGQWIDCRDTVNQWLEATVVEIMDPDDVLPPRRRRGTPNTNRRRRAPRIANDNAVGANDFDARQRLLLEPCEDGDSDEEEGELAGYRRRDNNNGVQLLLIHYNGWPHRWDEWIRSDSERIRPFRTRTRHQISSLVSPTPQSIYNEAPRTNIVDGDEADDRAALLPELSRAVNEVNNLLQQVVRSSSGTGTLAGSPTSSDLPWVYRPPRSTQDEDTISLEGEEPEVSPSNVMIPEETGIYGGSSRPNEANSITTESANYNRRQLQNLATLLDRLGRTLSDAAPHVASLAQSLPPPEETTTVSGDESELSLLGNTDDFDIQSQPPLGGLLSLWSRERRRHLQSTQNSEDEATPRVDPDHVDYVSGLVNTSRGEVRSGPRSRSQNDDVSNLLGAYLAAASLSSIVGADDSDNNEEGGATTGLGLGRLLGARGGGGGNGGIDIHIHAVVTAPGANTGGIGIGTLDGGTTGTIGTRNLFSSRERSTRSTSSILRNRSTTPAIIPTSNDDDEETQGLFSELYSENPEPVNPNGTPEPSPQRASRIDPSHSVWGEETEFSRRTPNQDELNDILNDAYGFSPGRRSGRFPPGGSTPTRQSSERTERRASGWTRLFRRRRSERDRRNDP